MTSSTKRGCCAFPATWENDERRVYTFVPPSLNAALPAYFYLTKSLLLTA